ncbi:MAG TPA: ATP-binding cassette domain-containing protein [Actinomycetaceae bacterium]|nr:ATP-binding cassette domain-containing protein [Actinomycetaceae bacterium]
MITVENLTKRYGSFTAVDDASFSAQPGRVTGFLGPNGAGKSTTLTILCALQRADSGVTTINGVPFRKLTGPGRHVGVMINASALHPGRTGRETLRLAAQINRQPASRADAMLERVGLEGSEHKRAGVYSLGMRQRLGIGVALMGEPHTLILDEPANGLDPEGIRWMRGLLDDFAAAGGTVLLSSHILSEVQAIADRIVVINRGRIVAEGDAAQLLGAGEGRVRVASSHLDLLGTLLQEAGLPHERAGATLIVTAEPERIAQIALDNRVLVTLLEPVRHNLEEVFFSLTAGGAQ